MLKILPVLCLAACTEALTLPDDPAAAGVPVGVITFMVGDLPVEAWYPAGDGEAGVELVRITDWVPASVTARLGAVELPALPVAATRDAPPRRLADPVPVVVFSHGLGGFRSQSASLTAHLASRGYVVLSTDHTGRNAQDLLPCLFSPPVEGCQLSGFEDDPGVPDVSALRDWIDAIPEDHPLAGRIDPTRVGLMGHSAGGATTGSAGQADPRWDALLPMAFGPQVTRDVPMHTLAGACDAAIPLARVEEGLATGAHPGLAILEGAGHHAFSDVCHFELGAYARDVLAERDDISGTILNGLVQLAGDGCTGTTPAPGLVGCEAEVYLDRPTEMRAVNALTTAFFDDALRGIGPGVAGLALPEVRPD